MTRRCAVISAVEQDRFPSSALTVAACGAGGVGIVAASGVAGGYFGMAEAGWLVAGGGVAVAGASVGALGRWWRNRKAATDIASERHAARHDALTGLVNRAELFRELKESLVWAARDKTVVGVLFLDLNKFKIVNDTLGHDAGDELLKVVAARLRATIRSTDVVARLGGDEFVVVCRDLLVGDSVLNVASSIQRRFREPVALGSTLHEVGASIGIAIAGPGDRRTPEDLVRDADAAMYTAKRERAPYKLFDDSHRSQLADQAAVEAELTRALAENQFMVFYQPIIDVIEHDLVGYEALLRWRHPERGLIEPKDFLPAADRVGIMPKLGATVLREVCAQIAVWNHLNPVARRLRV
ncbi:MAG: diguanylate cyclase, partial [Acidimicrobiia bacterium]|nr:diguanylate cyclase [Acidimicrobiia bacterium]